MKKAFDTWLNERTDVEVKARPVREQLKKAKEAQTQDEEKVFEYDKLEEFVRKIEWRAVSKDEKGEKIKDFTKNENFPLLWVDKRIADHLVKKICV